MVDEKLSTYSRATRNTNQTAKSYDIRSLKTSKTYISKLEKKLEEEK